MPRLQFLVVGVVTLTSAGAPSAAPPVICWRPPVDAPVADPFRTPACTWCPGNRGIEYVTVVGEPVRAVASGVVTFSGAVAGRRYVVVDVGDGYRVTFGDLGATGLRTGDAVVAGTTVGTASESLHLGVRHGDTYVDPAPLIGRVVARPRLVPADGSRARPAPSAALRCDRR